MYLCQARRVGAVVATDKKSTMGNKVPSVDHQKIAKLDRENEVAPPPKVAPSVGKVSIAFRSFLPFASIRCTQRSSQMTADAPLP